MKPNDFHMRMAEHIDSILPDGWIPGVDISLGVYGESSLGITLTRTGKFYVLVRRPGEPFYLCGYDHADDGMIFRNRTVVDSISLDQLKGVVFA